MTKEIQLTQGMVALVDDEDFEWLNQWKWQAMWCRKWYVSTRSKTISRTSVKMHRLIMNAPRSLDVDHINNNGLDNRRENLRLCTKSQNKMNVPKKTGWSSVYKGVHWYKSSNKWRAEINIDKKKHHLGYYTSEIDAARAWDKAALLHYGEFAILNFPAEQAYTAVLARLQEMTE